MTEEEQRALVQAAIDGRSHTAPAAQTPDEGQDDEHGRRTWAPVDLTDVLEGRYKPPTPTVGSRGDGVGLFYPGRMHSVAAESEAGKTWLMLAASRTELERGNAVVYIDFEDDEGGIVGRLLALGTDRDHIRNRFVYIRPEVPITMGTNRSDLDQALGDLRPTLVTIDGVTEGMVMHGLNPLDNKDVAEFGRRLVRPVADHGAAVVTLDHVTKDAEGRGRYALGAVHKLNGLNGAAYNLNNREPFGVGVTGRSGLYITKDRPGQLRKHAENSKLGKWFADLVGESLDADEIEVFIQSPIPTQTPSTFRPTHVMAKVAGILADNSGLSKNAIETMAGGKAAVVRTALELLVAEGYVSQEKRGQALVHTLVKPYGDEA